MKYPTSTRPTLNWSRGTSFIYSHSWVFVQSTVKYEFARNREEYLASLAGADQPRRGDMDGRGNLSQAGLLGFCEFFLIIAVDQIDFMSGRSDLDGMQKRIHKNNQPWRKVMKWIFFILAAFVSFSAGQAFADNFRCPNGNIVSTGDSISIVAVKCDPPAGSFKREEPMEIEFSRADRKTGSKIVYIEVQEWTYTQGSTLLHTLIFRNGVLSEVRTGGFVK